MTRLAVLGAPLLISSTIGCYSSQPVVGTALPAGSTIQLQVTDQGRAALADQMGPSVDIVEGRLISRDSTAWTLAVSSVHLLRGGDQVWSGERLSIRASDVARVSQKRFARGRTAIVTAAVLGVAIAVAKGSLAGLLSGSDAKTPSDSAASVRIPRP